MGCLPIIVLFLLGTGIGWLVGGTDDLLWGAGAGIVLGVLATLAFGAVLKRARRG